MARQLRYSLQLEEHFHVVTGKLPRHRHSSSCTWQCSWLLRPLAHLTLQQRGPRLSWYLRKRGARQENASLVGDSICEHLHSSLPTTRIGLHCEKYILFLIAAAKLKQANLTEDRPKKCSIKRNSSAKPTALKGLG